VVRTRRLADESPTTGSFRSILDGRFIIYEYSGSLNEKPLGGVAIIGCDLATQKFQSAWVDSFHMSTAMMFSEGTAGKRFSELPDPTTPDPRHHA
jgi:hypothetical protein